ncbi:SDR family NAD(P)-dependent oxidoreductase [Steroidobacter gossypii]|nr:SDR family oxidoreductase [Steroidobacter gossypii]
MVTGARGDIGRAVCSALGDAGALVVGTGLGDPPKDVRLQAWLQHDVTSAEDWAHVVREIRARFGRMDCLINNAGVALVERIEDTSIEQYRFVFRVNVESVLLGFKATVPLLRECGRYRSGGSAVVNISSTAGLRGVAFNSIYSASKGALAQLSKSAAKEFAALGYMIRVNTIVPGAVETRMMAGILSRYVDIGRAVSVEDQKSIFETLAPLGRMARPEEIAEGVAFLCSPAAAYMTGCELIMDGGAIA